MKKLLTSILERDTIQNQDNDEEENTDMSDFDADVTTIILMIVASISFLGILGLFLFSLFI